MVVAAAAVDPLPPELGCKTGGALSYGGFKLLEGEKLLLPPESILNEGPVLELESISRSPEVAGFRVVMMTGVLVAVEAPEFAPEGSMATESADCGWAQWY